MTSMSRRLLNEVGLLVGSGGEIIRQAEQASGAKIEIERSSSDRRLED